MALLVMDEWLWADAAGENGEARQRESIRLLFAIFGIRDRLVIVRGSAFEGKALNLWNRADTRRQQIAKFFNDNFLYNSDKAEFIGDPRLPKLPADLGDDIQPKDQYLVQAQLAYPESRVITTDARLKASLDRHQIPCEHRDAFITEYLARKSV
jgi:hypothetical protein